MPVGIANYGGEDIENWILMPKTIAKSKRNYAHFDARTDIVKVEEKITNPVWVSHHGFYPFIHYVKDCSKYSKSGKVPKKRDICYAAHIDRCLLQYYCHELNLLYNRQIKERRIGDVPIAYRSDLGLNNIQLAKLAFDYIKENPYCYVMIGDFTGFFDNLDHGYLKRQWCNLLGVEQLPPDHYTIFKNITKYSIWELNDLLRMNGLPVSKAGQRKLNKQNTVLTKEEFKRYRSHIYKHSDTKGIPQGLPISALLANVYMIDVDQQIKSIVNKYSGMYMRYSDDFIIILPVEKAQAIGILDEIIQIITSTVGLELEQKKTQIFEVKLPNVVNVGKQFFDRADTSKNIINYLGFSFDGRSIMLREKTISKYYYRMRRKARSIVASPEKKGKRYLYEKYSERGANVNRKSGKSRGNFFTYVNRAERIFDESDPIKRPFLNHMSKIARILKSKHCS